MRLIADGVIEREGVPGLAKRLGYSERHLNRVMTDELGAGPLAIARAHRAHTASLLIETTSMTFTEVAFAAGFGSVRQFNDTVREVFASSPTELRSKKSGARTAPTSPGSVSLRLPTRQPFAGDRAIAYLAAHAVPGIESSDGEIYRRTLDLPGGHGVIELRAADDHIDATVRLIDWTDLATAVHRIRRLLDLDADPEAVDAALMQDRSMGALVRAVPGRRAPGSTDAYETAIRAVVGQQVSLAGARTVTGRIVTSIGEPLEVDTGIDDELTHVFPTPSRLATAADDLFSMPTARRDTVRRLAAAVADGVVELGVGIDPAEARSQLLALKGIGPWTADYVVMRGLGHPDLFLGTDLVVVHALDAFGLTPTDAARWAPWRTYATHHLWASAAPRLDTPTITRKATS